MPTALPPTSSPIRTPDQRLRVFISSTTKELAAERSAVAAAVSSLRLHPVLFELGARPHAPRNLYEAYLQQSDIFVGIYWQSYGWIAPGMERSGIEDEYLLATGKPQLIYIKEPAPDRDERLKGLLQLIRDGARTSYKHFSSPEELADLVRDDLAVLLTERFDRGTPKEEDRRPPRSVPRPPDTFLGRQTELAAVDAAIEQGTRLITVTGPGGVGKTRFALEVASRHSESFTDGVHIVQLQSVRDPGLVATTISRSLGADQSADSTTAAIVDHLMSKELLLLLDNFEHILSASEVVVRILAECPSIVVLVTSRAPLRVRGEWEFPLAPLDTPQPDEVSLERLSQFDAVRLFLDRAGAVKPDWTAAGKDIIDIAQIARRLDGLPLAIELAAARVRIMPPRVIVDRLDDNRFRLLRDVKRDVPDRQHTLWSTIGWSFDLLDHDEQRLFERLGIFNGGWTLEAAEAVCEDLIADVVEGLSSLVEKSLVVRDDDGGIARYRMLETIHEYALERLLARGTIEDAADRHADYFLKLIKNGGQGMRRAEQLNWLHIFDREIGNIRAVMRHVLTKARGSDAVAIGWWMWQFWWLRGHVDEARRWMEQVLALDLPPRDRARARAVEGLWSFWQGDLVASESAAKEALRLFTEQGEESGMAFSQLPLGMGAALAGEAETAVRHFSHACKIFDAIGDSWGSAFARNEMCWVWVGTMIDMPLDTFENAIVASERAGSLSEMGMARVNLAGRQLRSGELVNARANLLKGLDLVFTSEVRGRPASYAMDVLAELAVALEEPRRATQFLGMGDGIRERTRTTSSPLHTSFRARLLEQAKGLLGEDAFDLEYATGRRFSYTEAMQVAIEWAGSPSPTL
jgi:predicted ATPase